MSLGKRISQIRQSKEQTQAQLSVKTGLAIPYISRIENDRIAPSYKTLQKIADALNVNLVDFFGYEKGKKFTEQCPVSVSGRCIAERIYGGGRKRTKLEVERYTPKQIELLQVANYLVVFGDEKVRRLLELVFAALMKSPGLNKRNKSGGNNRNTAL